MKPRIRRVEPTCLWPGAMSFQVHLPGGLLKYLTVDSWDKLEWYLAKWRHVPEWPAGVDLG
jgi:hypothetical protein